MRPEWPTLMLKLLIRAMMPSICQQRYDLTIKEKLPIEFGLRLLHRRVENEKLKIRCVIEEIRCCVVPVSVSAIDKGAAAFLRLNLPTLNKSGQP